MENNLTLFVNILLDPHDKAMIKKPFFIGNADSREPYKDKNGTDMRFKTQEDGEKALLKIK